MSHENNIINNENSSNNYYSLSGNLTLISKGSKLESLILFLI